MDLYFEIKEIKERQEKMLSRLDALVEKRSQMRLYDLADLTDLLKVSRRTLFTWLKQGILPHSKVGGKIWITDEHLKLFLENHSNESIGQETIKNRRMANER